MKTMKFRFWHKEQKKMYKMVGLLEDYAVCLEHDQLVIYPIFEGTVMRAIGRTDMNGKDIYECDYVRCHKDNDEVAEVIKIDHICSLLSEDGYLKDIPVKGNGKLEVVGNTYENPDGL